MTAPIHVIDLEASYLAPARARDMYARACDKTLADVAEFTNPLPGQQPCPECVGWANTNLAQLAAQTCMTEDDLLEILPQLFGDDE
jgi:hypothetical protein